MMQGLNERMDNVSIYLPLHEIEEQTKKTLKSDPSTKIFQTPVKRSKRHAYWKSRLQFFKFS